jgi:hypothetical protein
MTSKEIRELPTSLTGEYGEGQLDATQNRKVELMLLQEIAAQLAEANELRRSSADAVGRTGPR